jgi:hypothetical protein
MPAHCCIVSGCAGQQQADETYLVGGEMGRERGLKCGHDKQQARSVVGTGQLCQQAPGAVRCHSSKPCSNHLLGGRGEGEGDGDAGPKDNTHTAERQKHIRAQGIWGDPA